MVKAIKQDKVRFQKLVDLGCVVCLKEGHGHSQPEIHHIRKGQGMGQRAESAKTIPLCSQHHRIGGYGIALHAGQKEFESRYGDEQSLLEFTNKLINA